MESKFSPFRIYTFETKSKSEQLRKYRYRGTHGE